MHPLVQLVLDERSRQRRAERQAYVVVSICYLLLLGASFVIGSKSGYGAEDVQQLLEWWRSLSN